MPQYTRRDGNAMRQDAIRRSCQMYHRAAVPKSSDVYDFLPLREEEVSFPSPEFPKKSDTGAVVSSVPNAGIFGSFHPMELLEKFDKDQILILVLLVMLYKEGGDKKLLMALAYLLT